LLEGDLGISIRTRQPVLGDITRFLPATLELAACALAFGLLAGVLSGTVQALAPAFRYLRIFFVAFMSAPIFLASLLAILVFSSKLGWLPGSGRQEIGDGGPRTGMLTIEAVVSGDFGSLVDALAHLLLPALVLAMPIAAAVGQSLNASLVGVMRQGFIRTALGKGISLPRVVFQHGLRNAANAPLAMTALQIRLLFGNMLIVERIFGWPGIGQYFVQALAYSDLPAILGVTLLLGIIYILVGMAVEVVQSWADPRIELQ